MFSPHPIGGQPTPEMVDGALREDGFMPPKDEPEYELLIRSGNGWTPAGNFSSFARAVTTAMEAGADGFIVERPRRKRQPVRRA